MRLVYATDFHGDNDAYMALAALAHEVEARAVLLGGDLFADTDDVAVQLAFAEGPLRHFLVHLHTAAIPVLAIPGNVDLPAAIARLRAFEREGLLHLLSLWPFPLSDAADPSDRIDVLGYPLVPPTPHRIKDHERRDLATDRYDGPSPILLSSPVAVPASQTFISVPGDHLNRLPSIEEDLATIRPPAWPCALVAHSPPWGGALDLTDQGLHVGSRAIRAWIERHQPLAALHGHIHESPDRSGHWAERIGATVCVNPGPAAGPTLSAVVIETTMVPHGLRHTIRRNEDV